NVLSWTEIHRRTLCRESQIFVPLAPLSSSIAAGRFKIDLGQSECQKFRFGSSSGMLRHYETGSGSGTIYGCSFWAIYVLVSGTYHRVASRNRCQKSWKAERSRDSTVIIPLYVVPQIWAYSATISTSLDRFFLNCSQPAVAFFLSASVRGLTR